MESWSENIEFLYSRQDLSLIKKKYKEQLNIFLNVLWSKFEEKTWITYNDRIIDIKRWLICWSKQIFRDYLAAPHERMKQNFINSDIWRAIRCVRLSFNSWKSLILSSELPTSEWIINLDEYYKYLDDKSKNHFDKISFDLTKIEFDHFSSNNYNKQINSISGKSNDDLVSILNIQTNLQ